MPQIDSRGLRLFIIVISSICSAGSSDAATQFYRRSWAVIVGVSDYPQDVNLPILDFAKLDAIAVKQVLEDEFGYRPEDVVYIPNVDATKGAIVSALKRVGQAGMTDGDSFLFFYAGHGMLSEDRQVGYISGNDTIASRPNSWISLSWLRTEVARFPARHKLLVIDSCYAGSLFTFDPLPRHDVPAPIDLSSGTGKFVAPLPHIRQAGQSLTLGDNDALSVYLRGSAFVGISSGRLKPVADGSSGQDHSVFAANFLRVLRERAGSIRRDRAFTFRQLATLVETGVAEQAGSSQVPDWGAFSGDSGDFVFIPTIDSPSSSEANTLRLRQATYGADMLAAARLIQQANTKEAIAILDRNLPMPGDEDIRGFEWYHLWRLTHRETASMMPYAPAPARFRERNDVQKVAGLSISDDGATVASTLYAPPGSDGGLAVWRRDSRGAVTSLWAAPARSRVIGLSPSGRYLAVGQERFEKEQLITDLVVLEAGTGATLARVEAHRDPMESVKWTSDTSLISAGSFEVCFWSFDANAKRLTPVRKLKASEQLDDDLVRGVEVSGDAVAVRTTSRLFYCVHDSCSAVFESAPQSFWFSADARMLDWIVQGTLYSYSRQEKRTQKPIKIFAPSVSLAAPVGASIVAASDSAVLEFDGRTLRTLGLHEGRVRVLASNQRGNVVASFGEDDTIRLWDSLAAQPRSTCHTYKNSLAVPEAISHNGELIFLSHDISAVDVVSTANCTVLSRLDAPPIQWISSLAISGTDELLAVGGYEGKEVPDDSSKRAVVVRSVSGARAETLIEDTDADAAALAFSPDGQKLLVSGSTSIDYADLVGHSLRNLFHAGQPTPYRTRAIVGGQSAAFTSGNEVATSNNSKDVLIWDLASRDSVTLGGHGYYIGYLASANRDLLSVSLDRTARIWDVESRKTTAVLLGSLGRLYAGAFSKDNRSIAAGGEDQVMRIWTSSGSLAMTVNTDEPIRALRFSTDELVVGGDHGSIMRLIAAPETDVIAHYLDRAARHAGDALDVLSLLREYWGAHRRALALGTPAIACRLLQDGSSKARRIKNEGGLQNLADLSELDRWLVYFGVAFEELQTACHAPSPGAS